MRFVGIVAAAGRVIFESFINLSRVFSPLPPFYVSWPEPRADASVWETEEWLQKNAPTDKTEASTAQEDEAM